MRTEVYRDIDGSMHIKFILTTRDQEACDEPQHLEFAVEEARSLIANMIGLQEPQDDIIEGTAVEWQPPAGAGAGARVVGWQIGEHSGVIDHAPISGTQTPKQIAPGDLFIKLTGDD